MILSVITINYNNLEGLKKTTKSILSQTWRHFEWIIIDGGSTDGSKEFIEQTYQEFNDDSNNNTSIPLCCNCRPTNLISFWCSEPDNGVYDAMNKGIAKSSGEWINFMNSGDYFFNDNVLADFFERNIPSNINLVLGSTIVNYYFGAFLVNSIDSDGKTNFCHQSLFTRAESLKENLFDLSYKIIADQNSVHQIIKKGGKMMCIDLPIAVYEGSMGLSAKHYILREKEEFRIRGEQYSFEYWKKILSLYWHQVKRFVGFERPWTPEEEYNDMCRYRTPIKL